MKSYLSDCKQQVGEYTNMDIIADGVPQGIALGATLLICCINNILSKKINCNVRLYADSSSVHD